MSWIGRLAANFSWKDFTPLHMVFDPPCLDLCSSWWLRSHAVSINVQAFLRPMIRIGTSPLHSRQSPKVKGHPRIKGRKVLIFVIMEAATKLFCKEHCQREGKKHGRFCNPSILE